jgi:hypothetical protein
MGRKNIITQIDELELDHDQEHFEEHLDVVKKEKTLKNVFVMINDHNKANENQIEEIENSKSKNDSQEEQIVVTEKTTTKNSRKKNTNQESSS